MMSISNPIVFMGYTSHGTDDLARPADSEIAIKKCPCNLAMEASKNTVPLKEIALCKPQGFRSIGNHLIYSQQDTLSDFISDSLIVALAWQDEFDEQQVFTLTRTYLNTLLSLEIQELMPSTSLLERIAPSAVPIAEPDALAIIQDFLPINYLLRQWRLNTLNKWFAFGRNAQGHADARILGLMNQASRRMYLFLLQSFRT